MKKTILLIVTAGSLVLPAITHADTLGTKKKKAARTAAATVPAAKPSRDRVIYYISTEPATGSNIPMVRRSYGGRIDSASSPAVYGSTQIQQSGALDVSTALFRLDPSITSGSRR